MARNSIDEVPRQIQPYRPCNNFNILFSSLLSVLVITRGVAVMNNFCLPLSGSHQGHSRTRQKLFQHNDVLRRQRRIKIGTLDPD